MSRSHERIGATATLSVTTLSAQETRTLGARLGRHLRAGDIVRLEGELGAGKTTFVQGMVAALGGSARVTSPTFTLVNEYRTANGLTVHHMDAYRLGFAERNEQAVDTLGLNDLLEGAGVLVVEWSERIAALLPAEGLTVHFAYGASEDERTLRFEGTDARSVGLVRALA